MSLKKLLDFKNKDLVDLQISSFIVGVLVGLNIISIIAVNTLVHNILLLGVSIGALMILLVYQFKLIKHLAFRRYVLVEEHDGEHSEDIYFEEDEEDEK